MANIIIRPPHYIPERLVTPEQVFTNRRKFLRQMGIAGAGIMSLSAVGCGDGYPDGIPGQRQFEEGIKKCKNKH